MTSKTFNSSMGYFLFLSIFSIGLFFLDTKKFLTPLHAGFDTMAVPLKSSIYLVKQRLDETFSFLTFWKNGTAKLRFLEQRVAELTVDSEKLTVLEKENAALLAQIGITDPAAYSLIPARTIGFSRYLFINQGEEDGVKRGMAVLSRDILVGVVSETAPKTSKILLPTDPDSKIPVKTAKTGARGILLGQFGSSIILTRVVQSEELKIGDAVVTTGEGDLPLGFVVGTILSVQKQETELFQEAEIKPLLDYTRLEHVFVNINL